MFVINVLQDPVIAHIERMDLLIVMQMEIAQNVLKIQNALGMTFAIMVNV